MCLFRKVILRRLTGLLIALLVLVLPPWAGAWYIPDFQSWEEYLGKVETIFIATATDPSAPRASINGVIYANVQVDLVLRGPVDPGPTRVLARYDPETVTRFLFLGNRRNDTVKPTSVVDPDPFAFMVSSYGVIPLAPDFPLDSLRGKSPAEQLRAIFGHRLNALMAGQAVSPGDLHSVPIRNQISHLKTWFRLPRCASWRDALSESDCVFVGRPICPEPSQPGSGHEHEPATEHRVRVDTVLLGRRLGLEVRVFGVLGAQEGDEFLIVGKSTPPTKSGRVATVIPRAFVRLSGTKADFPDGRVTPERQLAAVRKRTASLRPNFTLSRGSLERLDDKEILAQFWTWLERRGR